MFFYGWLMVAAGFLVLMISWGCQFSFSVFLIPLTEHFGWTRANTAGVFSVNILLFGVGSIFSGKLTERFGRGWPWGSCPQGSGWGSRSFLPFAGT